MTAVYTAFSNWRYFQNPLDETSPTSSSIGTFYAPNWSKELDPFTSSTPLQLCTTQQKWKYALTMLWGMHISNFAAQFRLAREEFMQNDNIYDILSHGKMVLPPIGINLVKVVCECQHAYIFIFCAQQPWLRQPHNSIDTAIAALSSHPSQGKTTPAKNPYLPITTYWSFYDHPI